MLRVSPLKMPTEGPCLQHIWMQVRAEIGDHQVTCPDRYKGSEQYRNGPTALGLVHPSENWSTPSCRTPVRLLGHLGERQIKHLEGFCWALCAMTAAKKINEPFSRDRPANGSYFGSSSRFGDKGYPDPSLATPYYVARPTKSLAFHDEGERVGKPQRAVDLDSRACIGDAAKCAG